MSTTILDSAQKVVKNWWLSILLGILYLVAGFWVVRTPMESYISLSIITLLFSFLLWQILYLPV